ncbi:MAG: c-type cytochrome [Candidatus Eisenbacteria bacterium]
MPRTEAIRRFGLLLLTVIAITAFRTFQVSAQPAKPAAPAAKGNAATAKAVFTSKCVACHKADGSGGVKLTGNATPSWKNPKVWSDPKRKNVDAYLRNCIVNGVPKSGMVAWGKTGQLKPQQIEDMIAYIKTFKK